MPDGRRFAALEGSATAAVGLTTALWVEQVEARDRRAYERRIGGPIRALSGQRLARRAAVYLPATFVDGRASFAAGTDVSELRALAATLRDPTSVFAGTATPIATWPVAGGSSSSRARASAGAPEAAASSCCSCPRAGWASRSPRTSGGLAISLDGRRLEGGLDDRAGRRARASRPSRGAGGSTSTPSRPPRCRRRCRGSLSCGRPRPRSIVYLVGRAILRRRRAERLVDDIFDVSLDPLCVVGLDGWFKRVNPAFERDARLHRPRAALAPDAGVRPPRRPRDDAGRDPGARERHADGATS